MRGRQGSGDTDNVLWNKDEKNIKITVKFKSNISNINLYFDPAFEYFVFEPSTLWQALWHEIKPKWQQS